MNEGERSRLETAYKNQKHRLLARVQSAGRTLEEAEDLLHDVYAETLEKLPLLSGLQSLSGWIYSLLKRRLIDAWRRDRMKKNVGETEVAEDIIRDVISGAGLDPLEYYVRENLIDALNAALKALPPSQRQVIEAQVFGGKTFREISEETGVGIDTLKARKRYGIGNLSRSLRHWISD